MVHIPSDKPFVPPIVPKEAAKTEKTEAEKRPAQQLPIGKGIGRGPELDSSAIAVRMSALATEAKSKEITAEAFEEIIEEAIKLTGLQNPQSALEEDSKRLQKEIEIELAKIKGNKDLMEEAESWQEFARLLAQMNEQQVAGFLDLLKVSIKEI